jgi:hypothetical protein
MAEWAGAANIQKTLKDLGSSLPPSASRVKAVVNECLKHHKEFKYVVYELERFIRKAVNNDTRIVGLHVIDAVSRKSDAKLGKDKDNITKRIVAKMKDILSHIIATQLSSSQSKSINKVMSEWTRRETFSSVKHLFQAYMLTNDSVSSNILLSSPEKDPDMHTGNSIGTSNAITSVPASFPPPPLFQPSSTSGSLSTTKGSALQYDPRRKRKVKDGERDNGDTDSSAVNDQLAKKAGVTTTEEPESTVSVAFDRLSAAVKSLKGRPLNVSSMAPLLVTRPKLRVEESPVGPSAKAPKESFIIYPQTFGEQKNVIIESLSRIQFLSKAHQI